MNYKKKIFILTIIVITLVALIMLFIRYARTTTNDYMRRRIVLSYYKTINYNEEKYEAACFLLDNMKYQYSLGRMWRDDAQIRSWIANSTFILKELIDSFGIYNIPNKIIDETRNTYQDSIYQYRLDENVFCNNSLFLDNEYINPAFLIQHIDNSYDIWKKSNYSKNLSIEKFKESILPYKSFNGCGFHRTSKTLNELFGKLIIVDSIKSYKDYINEYRYIIKSLRDINGKKLCKEKKGLYDLFFLDALTCEDMANYSCNILRSIGIPIFVEYTIGYKSYSGRHYFCSIYNSCTDSWITFNPESYNPVIDWYNEPNLNIYRCTYNAQKNTPFFLRGENEPIPAELSNPCIIDVTQRVENVYSKTFNIDIKGDYNLAYLTTFNRDTSSGLLHTTWGLVNKIDSTVTFDNILSNVLYFPIYYNNKKRNTFYSHFFLNKEGEICQLPHINSDTTSTSIILTRKFPRKKNMIKAAEELIGSTFIGSNDRSMKIVDTLYIIDKMPDPTFKEYQFSVPKAYQIYRFEASPNFKKAHISMLEWITSKKYNYTNVLPATRLHVLAEKDTILLRDSLKVKIIDEPIEKMQMKSEYDGNMQTSPSAYPNITLWLKEPQIVSSVRFAPLNADNGIKAGHKYKLMYWNEGWKEIDTRTAKYEFIRFDNVPKNKLYLLKNITEGTEEELFVINEKGEQLFIYSDIIDKQ